VVALSALLAFISNTFVQYSYYFQSLTLSFSLISLFTRQKLTQEQQHENSEQAAAGFIKTVAQLLLSCNKNSRKAAQ